MSTSHKIVLGIAAVIIVLAGLFFSFGGSKMLGGTNATLFQNFSAGASIGNPGSQNSPVATKLALVKVGTCTPTFSGTSLAATSTGQFFCTGITGVASGDIVFAQFSSGGRASATAFFDIVGAYATTTDRIGINIANWSGTATTSFAQATSSGIRYQVFRTVTNP